MNRRPRFLSAAFAALLCGMAVLGAGCSLFPTQRYRLASYQNDHIFLQAEGQRICGRPVPIHGCDAAKAALNRMKTHLEETASVSSTGHITLQLKALARDKKEVLASGIYR